LTVAGQDKVPTSTDARNGDIEAFLAKVKAAPKPHQTGSRGRLIFAMDATASRQPTWDRAAHIQGEMFTETDALGGLELQLCFYRGFGEFKVSPWLTRSAELVRMMTRVTCLAGQTQIQKVLRHAINETQKKPVNALVFIGDCMEEDVDRLGAAAGELGVRGVPAFVFHEGGDPVAAFAFEQIARLSGGACCRFDAASPRMLRDLLAAVAVFAAGGRPALADFSRGRSREVLRIAHQMGSR
jgi:hypothetical protein